MIFSWLGLSLDVSGGFVGLLDGGWCVVVDVRCGW